VLARGFRAFGDAPDPRTDTVTVEGVHEDGSRCRLPGTVAAVEGRYLAALPSASAPAGTGPWSFQGHLPAGGVGDAEVPAQAAPVHGTFGLAKRRFVGSVPLGEPGAARGVLVPLHTGRFPSVTTLFLIGAGGEVLDEIALDRPVAPGWFWAALRAERMTSGMRIDIQSGVPRPENHVAFGTPHWLP
jgi:hypothetical protein